MRIIQLMLLRSIFPLEINACKLLSVRLEAFAKVPADTVLTINKICLIIIKLIVFFLQAMQVSFSYFTVMWAATKT